MSTIDPAGQQSNFRPVPRELPHHFALLDCRERGRGAEVLSRHFRRDEEIDHRSRRC